MARNPLTDRQLAAIFTRYKRKPVFMQGYRSLASGRRSVYSSFTGPNMTLADLGQVISRRTKTANQVRALRAGRTRPLSSFYPKLIETERSIQRQAGTPSEFIDEIAKNDLKSKLKTQASLIGRKKTVIRIKNSLTDQQYPFKEPQHNKVIYEAALNRMKELSPRLESVKPNELAAKRYPEWREWLMESIQDKEGRIIDNAKEISRLGRKARGMDISNAVGRKYPDKSLDELRTQRSKIAKARKKQFWEEGYSVRTPEQKAAYAKQTRDKYRRLFGPFRHR